jgi:anaerobic selenocysteine-containing dehydrogenase
MHNLDLLVKGDDPCTLLLHPSDAQRLKLTDGAHARITSAAATLTVAVSVTEAIMPGVVSLPHGWGHGQPGTAMRVAAAHPGVNFNQLAPDSAVEPLSGDAILNAIPVTLAPTATTQPTTTQPAPNGS